MKNLGLLLIFATGIRIGELAALQWKDVDFKKKCINISATEVRYDGEHTIKDSPKSEAGIRTVYIPDNWMYVLQELRRLNAFGDYIFVESGEKIKTYQFRNRIYKVCDAVGIERKSPHKIRKTYASRLKRAGVDDEMITSLMGHVDIKVTEDHYLFDVNDEIEKQRILSRICAI